LIVFIVLSIFSLGSLAEEQKITLQPGEDGEFVQVGGGGEIDVMTEDLEDLEMVAMPSPYADIVAAYPDRDPETIVAGEVMEILVGFSNSGQKAFNISSIYSSLHHKHQHSWTLQNFTRTPYNAIVLPSQEISLTYYFFPDSLLDPEEFVYVAKVDYFDETGEYFESVIVNKTVTVVDPDSSLDTQSFFYTVGGVAVGGLVLYIGFLATQGDQNQGRKKRSAKGGKKDDDWLSGTSVGGGSKGKKGSKRR